jgi:hypothetical protein
MVVLVVKYLLLKRYSLKAIFQFVFKLALRAANYFLSYLSFLQV